MNYTIKTYNELKKLGYTDSEIRSIISIAKRTPLDKAIAYVEAQKNSVPAVTGKNGTFTSIA